MKEESAKDINNEEVVRSLTKRLESSMENGRKGHLKNISAKDGEISVTSVTQTEILADMRIRQELMCDYATTLAKLMRQLADSRHENKVLVEELHDLKIINKHIYSQIRDISRELVARENECNDRKGKLKNIHTKVKTQKKMLHETRIKNSNYACQLNSLEEDVEKIERHIACLQKMQKELYCTTSNLFVLYRKLSLDFDDVMKSWRWIIGNRLIRFIEKILLRPQVPLASDHMIKLFDQIKEYEKVVNLHFESNSQEVTCTTESVEQNQPNVFSKKIDVIVCIHNALNDVKKCLESLVAHKTISFRLYLVNDGSNHETSEFIEEFCGRYVFSTLLKNKKAVGYTKAANQALKVSNGDYVILLNSDTVVPKRWLERMIVCGESNQKIGIIGPLSNAASWQSVPQRFEGKNFAINELSAGWTVDKMAELVEEMSENKFPRVPFLNGFCLAVKRCVIDKIGYLDEESFPYGYGEENDYCLQAINAGFELAVADNSYVFHAKSRSFGHNTRHKLSKQGGIMLRNKHGNQRIDALLKDIRDNEDLNGIREKIASQVDKIISVSRKQSLSILFILPVHGGGGGSHSVLQESLGLIELGVEVCIANKECHKSHFLKSYGHIYKLYPGLFSFYSDVDELKEYAAKYNVVIATVFHSVKVLREIIEAHPKIAPGYYVQDYEPWFFEKNTRNWKEAFDSYTLIPRMTLFAKTKWVCNIVEKYHDVEVNSISPGLDHAIFFPSHKLFNRKWPVKLVAMVRPNTPRRGPGKTMRLLKKIKGEFGERAIIHIFGCDEQSPDYQNVERDFIFKNHGVLKREDVADLLRSCDIFVDFSDYQAFGRTGLEAMACGCATILPEKGGIHEFAVDYENSLLVDTRSESECYEKTRELVIGFELRMKLRKNGLMKAAEYSVRKAALSELVLFEEVFNNWNRKQVNYVSKVNKGLISVAGLLPKTSTGSLGGSGYIRIVQPLTHDHLKGKFIYRTSGLEEVCEQKPDIVLVQRNALQRIEESEKLIDYCHRHNIAMVYETDDNLFRIHEGHVESEAYHVGIEANKLFAINADLVIVASENLKNNLNHLNSNIVVIPNSLDEKLWIKKKFPVSSKNTSKGIRILYQGTTTHFDDLMLLEKPIKKLKEKYGEKVTLDLVGIVPRHLKSVLSWCRLIEVPAKLNKDYPSYVKWITGHNAWHIGVIPLVDNEFNRCKSYIKFLDYSALGLATVASNLGFYNNIITVGETGLLVNNTEDSWYEALQKVISDSQLRATLALNAYEQLIKEHLLDTVALQWKTALEKVQKGQVT